MRVLMLPVIFSLALFAPAAAQTPTQPPQPPQPFPEGARVAFLNLQRVATESVEGKAATAKIQDLNNRKVAELNEKQKQLQAAQQKLQEGSAVLSDPARAQLEREIDRMQRELQFFTQDAQAEVQDLQQELMGEFEVKLRPVIESVATEKGLHMVFSAGDAGIVWATGALDITAEVIQRFDQAAGGSPPAGGAPRN